LHPLAAHPYQRRFELGQRLQFFEREDLITERDFPVKLNDLFKRQPGAAPQLSLSKYRLL
jgi:hypothetical protein